MVSIVWTWRALQDLRELRDYIGRDSLRYAQIEIEKIEAAAGRLARFPRMGHRLEEMPRADYRAVVVGSYRLIHRYESARARVLVMAVTHARRRRML